MKSAALLCLLLLFPVSPLIAQRDTAFVRFSGDTVNVCNINIEMHCAALFASEVTVRNDTVFITEHDTSAGVATCICMFDFTASLVGLEPGSYTARIYRAMKAFTLPLRDTLVFVHELHFNVSRLAPPFVTSVTMRACHQDLTPAWTPVHYPLHPGDLWDYCEDIQWRQRQTVEEDSAYFGGHGYAVVQGMFADTYQRQEGDRVYAGSLHDSTEHLLYDFTKLPGDTVATWGGTYDTTDMILTHTGMTGQFGTPLRVWTFLRDTRKYIDDECFTTIVDSVGPIQYLMSFGPRLEFQGARINGRIYGTIVSVTETGGPEQPSGFRLEQNRPNPWNPSTVIGYTVGDLGTLGRGDLGRNVLVQLTVYDILGRQVAVLVNEPQAPGRYQVSLRAAGLPSGTYFYMLQSNGVRLVKRMMVVK